MITAFYAMSHFFLLCGATKRKFLIFGIQQVLFIDEISWEHFENLFFSE